MLISVIIPTRNRPIAVRQCVEAIRICRFPHDQVEIIVVDDASDVLPETLATAGAPAIQLLRLPEHGGPGVARNAGVQIARGKLIAFTDDDCLPQTDWLSALWSAHQQHPTAMLGGRLVNSKVQRIASIANQVVSDIVYSHYNVNPLLARFFATNNVAMPRQLFARVGGFDPEFSRASEDRDLCDRWLVEQLPMVYIPEAVVAHNKTLTIPAFCRQHFRYGVGAHDYHRARSGRGSGRLTQEMSFHAELPRLAIKHLKPLPAWQVARVIPLLAAWQVANAGGFFWQAAIARFSKRCELTQIERTIN